MPEKALLTFNVYPYSRLYIPCTVFLIALFQELLYRKSKDIKTNAYNCGINTLCYKDISIGKQLTEPSNVET